MSAPDASAPPDEESATRDLASAARDLASATRDETSVPREGAGAPREGAGAPREGAGATREGAGVTREGAGATRADVIGALAIVLATAAVALGPRLVARLSAHPSAAECEALIGRYVELKERSVTAKLDAKRYAAALENARRSAGPALEACTTHVTLEEARCAKGANSADELERCLH